MLSSQYLHKIRVDNPLSWTEDPGLWTKTNNWLENPLSTQWTVDGRLWTSIRMRYNLSWPTCNIADTHTN